ncbi:prolipoprotein diacylglyceryl transferase [Halovulum sp. GXIMD14793]
MYALTFPEIDPALFTIELFGREFALRWYALAYIAGLLFAAWYVARILRRPKLWGKGGAPMDATRVESLLTWMVVGVILGGRIGYVLFYRRDLLETPMELIAVWNGGMSFHGGFLGVVLGIVGFSLVNKVNMVRLGDVVAVATPVGLMLGRLANFINGELWGRPTTASWGMIFPSPEAQVCPVQFGEICARHPSQLYQAGLEGLLLFLVLSYGVWRLGWLKYPGRTIGVFLLGYGLARTLAEGFRQGDSQFVTDGNPFGHYLHFGTGPEAWGLTMGQLLSLPMVALGLVILLAVRRRS